jgi:predicted nucleic acid-binding Zn ribbon protein
MTDERGPRSLRDGLARVSRELGIAEPDAFEIVMSQWSEIVGLAVAARARPRYLRDGILTVDVDDGGWATQLRYSEGDVIARYVAAGVKITRVRVTVGRSR